jgi:hypothetical protein
MLRSGWLFHRKTKSDYGEKSDKSKHHQQFESKRLIDLEGGMGSTDRIKAIPLISLDLKAHEKAVQ